MNRLVHFVRNRASRRTVDLAEVAPSHAVAVLHIHSVDDPRAIYDGAKVCRFRAPTAR